jgi:hypothetical protein
MYNSTAGITENAIKNQKKKHLHEKKPKKPKINWFI